VARASLAIGSCDVYGLVQFMRVVKPVIQQDDIAQICPVRRLALSLVHGQAAVHPCYGSCVVHQGKLSDLGKKYGFILGICGALQFARKRLTCCDGSGLDSNG